MPASASSSATFSRVWLLSTGLQCLRVLVVASGICSVAHASSAEDPLWPQVAAILQQHCLSCHGSESQESGLRLDTLQGLSRGGKAGPSIQPGAPGESLLMVAVRKTDSALQMPPEGRLTDSELSILEQWIAADAPHPDGKLEVPPPALPFDPQQARGFWAFQPVTPPSLPEALQNQPSAAIDHLIDQHLQPRGIQRNPPADKLTLIRRATWSLTGLPPAEDDIRNFLADESPEAFARVVDRLLASSQYGEHWGRHWLDVVRYADSNGLDENIAHGNAWRYRNYVIESFNRDKPLNIFLQEQIAGDLMVTETTPEATRNEQLTATGFLSLGPKVLAEGDELKLHLDIIDEQLDTIGRSMLGLTIGCARCHDHKFDPISQADYYALAGIFQSTRTMESLKRIAKWNENSIATGQDKVALEVHQAKVAAKKAEIDGLLKTAAASAGDSGTPIPEDQLPDDTRTQLAALRDALKQLEATIPELPTAMGVTEGDITSSRILPRGNHLAPGRLVPRTIPVVLNVTGTFNVPADHSGRLELAQWITGNENPLTTRVLVNRVWRWHFGRGLVPTADNFGKLGERPENPELLDWLAAQLVRENWSLKQLHRTILLSQTWQATADRTAAADQIDPDNHLQWRWTVQRLGAESVRDSVLAATGLLDRSMGQSMLHVKNREFLFDHTSKDLTSYDSLRRSVYLPVIRNNLYDAMSLFDCTDGTVPNGDRGSSTVASQALFLMNSPLVLNAAEHLARQLITTTPEPRQRLTSLVMRTLGRPATAEELADLLQATERLGQQLQADGVADGERELAIWTGIAQTMLMSNEFLYVR